MAELTSAGLTTRTQAEILDAIEADQRAEISDSLDLSTSSPLGQVNYLDARAQRMLEEALEALASALDPDGATGQALWNLGALTGTIREAATSSRVEVVCTLAAGTYAAGSLAAAPAGRPEDRFLSAEEVTTAGGDVSVVFEAEETGPIQATADTLEIASPVAGWTAIVSHPDATLGQDIETEAAFRARRTAEVEAPGSSSVDGIAADLTQNLPLIETVTVVENDTDATVDSIPAHAIEVIVFGPEVPTADDDQAVADQIWASKAAGIGTYGTTSKTVVDSMGRSHTVRFTRPADVSCSCTLAIEVDSATYAGDSDVTDAVVDGAAALLPGRNLSWSMIVAWAQSVTGVLRVTGVTVNGVSFGTVAISAREIVELLAGDVSVASTPATA